MFQWAEEHHHLSLSVASIAIFLICFKLCSRSSKSKLNLPPSPCRLPIVGNLHQLGSLPHRSLASFGQKHGSLMMLHFGQIPTLIVSSADAAREIMKTQDLIFSSRPKLMAAEKLLYSGKDIAMSPYGEYWRQVRKISVLELLSVQRVESFRSVREEEVDLMIEKIRQSCLSSPVDLSETLISFTNDVTCRVALGRKFEGDEGGKKFWKMIREFMYIMGVFNVGDYIPWLSWMNDFNGFNTRIERNWKELDSFFESVIEEHSQSWKEKGSNDTEDFVDVLLRIKKDGSIGVPFGRDNIKALILDVFVSGTDTMSATLVWVMTELIKHPEIMKQVQMEIREVTKGKPYITEEDLGKMYHLNRVIRETLRLHIPVPLLVPRESVRHTKLKGYDIPAKTRVLINAWAIGRDPVSWENPDQFQPDRFLKSSGDYRGLDFEYIPFGAGRRGCPGIVYATHNMELPLANLLFHFDWALPDGMREEDLDVAEGHGVVAYKKLPLELVPTTPIF